MIDRIIDDIQKALDNDAYLAALTLALTIPDICGKAKYPNKGTKARYKGWYDEYVGEYEQSPLDIKRGTNMPYLSGDVIYSLRNSMLHEGSPNVESKFIDEFVLVIEKKKAIEIYGDSADVITSNHNDKCVSHYRLNVRGFCQIISANARGYYNKNVELFDFFNYSIMDWDEEVMKLHNR